MTRKGIGDVASIAQVTVPGFGGTIGLSAFPGRDFVRSDEPVSAEQANHALSAIRGWGADILVSLIEDAEYELYGLPVLEGNIPAGMKWLKLPIADMGAPDAAWEAAWNEVGPELRAILRYGGKICLHCIGGRGRSGTVAALLLIELGMAPKDAIEAVRSVRPGAIETRAQELYLFAKKLPT